LFANSIEIGEILNELIINMNIESFQFVSNYDLDTPPKFQDEEIRYLLVLNAALPLLTQICSISFWLFSRLMYFITSFGNKGCCYRWFKDKVDLME
jgi:hypothetical protein